MRKGILDLFKGNVCRGIEASLPSLTWHESRLEEPVVQQAILIRQQHRIRLPDAVIAATALHLGLPLVAGASLGAATFELGEVDGALAVFGDGWMGRVGHRTREERYVNLFVPQCE